MRYRAFGATRRSISALTLTLPRNLDRRDGVALVYAALESGVNGFELRDPTPDAAAALGEALASIERHVAMVILRIGEGDARGALPAADLSRDAILKAVEGALRASSLDRFDAVLLDNPQLQAMTSETLSALVAVREGGRSALIGVTGEVDAATTEVIDAMGVVYNLRSAGADRNRIKAAAESGFVLFGERFFPRPPSPTRTAPTAAPNWLGLRRRVKEPLETAPGYDFLRRTPSWAADEICLAYALTEPALSTVLVEASTPEDITRLAKVPERDMPSQLPAQIEMARFAGGV